MLLSRFYQTTSQGCSSSYKNISKLSLKVYYLQEISKIVEYRRNDTSYTPNELYRNRVFPIDHYTFNENDLKQLSKDINDSVHQLSPSQLLSTAISYRKLQGIGKKEWNRLFYGTLNHVYGNTYNINTISPSQISMILYSYALKFTNQIPLSYRLLKSSVKETGSLNERDISMLLYYIRRTRCIPKTINSNEGLKNAQILRSIALCLSKEGGNKLVRLTPKGMIPWSIIYHACNLIKKKAKKLDNKSIGFHSSSLALLNIRDKKTLETFVSLMNSRKSVPKSTLCSLLYSLAKLKYRPKSDLSPLLDHINKSILLFEDKDLAQIVYSLGQLGIRYNEIFDSLSMILKTRMDYQSPQHLSMFARGYSKLGIYDESTLNLIVDHSLKLLTGFTFPQIVSLIDSLSVLGHFDNNVFLKLLDYMCSFQMDEIPDYLITQMNRISYCIQLELKELVEISPNYVKSLFERFQGQFLLRENKEPDDSLKRTLKEIGIEFRTLERVGPYLTDAIFGENLTIEMLSNGSICAVTKELLGSARMQKRHMEILGYTHIQISRDDWVKKSESGRRKFLQDILNSKLNGKFV